MKDLDYNQFDKIFWLGDLNYRVELTFDESSKIIKMNNLKQLYENDQLNQSVRKNRVFTDFKEGEIEFNPTFKINYETREYETKKNRTPSWCDRILYKNNNTNYTMEQKEYGSYEKLNISSDHIPVYSIFQVQTKRVEIEKLFFKENLKEYMVIFHKVMLYDINTKELKRPELYFYSKHEHPTHSKTFKLNENSVTFKEYFVLNYKTSNIEKLLEETVLIYLFDTINQENFKCSTNIILKNLKVKKKVNILDEIMNNQSIENLEDEIEENNYISNLYYQTKVFCKIEAEIAVIEKTQINDFLEKNKYVKNDENENHDLLSDSDFEYILKCFFNIIKDHLTKEQIYNWGLCESFKILDYDSNLLKII
jgi:hypothetical protein